MTNWQNTLKKITACEDIERILLFGPPGTGKSYWPLDFYGADNVYRIQCSKGMDEAYIVGVMGVKDGNTQNQNGLPIRAMEEGKILVIDEIDRFNPDIESTLQAILDDHRTMSVADLCGGIHKPKKGFKVIATTNSISPQDALPRTIVDRFQVYIPVTTPAQGALDELPAHLKAVVENKYRSASQWTFAADVSYRRVSSFAKLTASGVEEKLAAECVFGSAANEFLSTVVSAKQEA